MKKGKYDMRMKKVVLTIAVIALLTGCSLRNEEAVSKVPVDQNTLMETSEQFSEENTSTEQSAGVVASEASWAWNTLIDTDLPELDYADEDKIIFHAYFGLFVYDLNSEKIVNSLDLESLGCQKVQGGCKIVVSNDGSDIWLMPQNRTATYCFSWNENLLTEKNYEEHESFIDYVSKWKVLTDELGNKIRLCSDHAVRFKDGTFGYIFMEDARISTMTYCRGDKEWQLFNHEDCTEPVLRKQKDSYYEAYRLYAQQSLDTFLSVYRTFYNEGDYAGICVLTNGIEYSDEKQKVWKDTDIQLIQMQEVGGNEEDEKTIKCIFQSADREQELFLNLKLIEENWYAEGLPR